MDIAILIVAVLALFVSTGTFCLVALDRRGRLIAEEKKVRPVIERSATYQDPPTETIALNPHAEVSFHEDNPALPPFPAPTVGDDTLKQWLIHRYRRDNVWNEVVDDFYVRAASNHTVRPYFAGRDLAEIKKKFLATLLILTDKGVSEPAAAALVKKHVNLDITEDAYDATMEALEVVLERYGVPESTLEQMVPMINYFRETMVTT